HSLSARRRRGERRRPGRSLPHLLQWGIQTREGPGACRAGAAADSRSGTPAAAPARAAARGGALAGALPGVLGQAARCAGGLSGRKPASQASRKEPAGRQVAPMTPTDESVEILVVRRVLPVARERVFAAW